MDIAWFIQQVCQAAVGVTGDICRALGTQVLPFSDELMMTLLENLGVSRECIYTVELHHEQSWGNM